LFDVVVLPWSIDSFVACIWTVLFFCLPHTLSSSAPLPHSLFQVMLWERKLLLEKEMRDVLDPSVGQDVVGEMRKEIHRMQLRHGELMRLQDKLMAVGGGNGWLGQGWQECVFF
jgi:hypothetical protein